MIDLRTADEVRTAEGRVPAALSDGTLMQRAATALTIACAQVLETAAGSVGGSRVVILAGSGSNGGDALWAGAGLAGRGCRVDALALSDRIHSEGAAALREAGGRLHRWAAGDSALARVIEAADLVVDGILGIGGTGPLRDEAADLVKQVTASGALVVCVDVPSGVDADTGAAHPGAVVADVTVTFGAVKPGLVLAPGAQHSGVVRLVDIGLDFGEPATSRCLESIDVAAWVAEPAPDAHKYRRGVVAVSAGSRAYPGAALLAVAAARRGNVGMTRFLDRADGAAALVVSAFPDVVVDGAEPDMQTRVDAWACGPGFPGEAVDELTVLAVLAADTPVVLDAGALSVVAQSAAVRKEIASRRSRGLTTVLTPHEGEFERLCPGLLGTAPGRLAAAVCAAAELGAIIVLKGPGTVIAGPDGRSFIDLEGTADLGTAGSGDVLTGLAAALLAGAWAGGRREADHLLTATAAAVWLHGAAGRIAGRRAPVVATDISDALPEAVRLARFGPPVGP